MKIIIATDHFPPEHWGGAESVAYMQACGLHERGHDVLVISTTQVKHQAGWSDYSDFKICRIYASYHPRWRAWQSLNNSRVARDFGDMVRAINPDVVHFHNVHQHLSYRAIKLAKRYCPKVFLTAHDVMSFAYGKFTPSFTRRGQGEVQQSPPPSKSPIGKEGEYEFSYKVPWGWNLRYAKKRYNPLRNFRIKYYLKYVDKILAVSHALKDALTQNGISNVEVIHNGIDVTKWDKDFDVNKFRQELGLADKPVVLFVGRLIGSKGRDVLLQAISIVKRQLPDVMLLTVGAETDPRYDKVKELAKELKLENNIKQHKAVPKEEMYKFYKAADVVVVPSLTFDSFPTINLEAGACRKPVIATHLGGSREIIEHGKTGYIVNPYDINNLAHKITELLQDTKKAHQFGEVGYERIKDKFNLNALLDSLLLFYNK